MGPFIPMGGRIRLQGNKVPTHWSRSGRVRKSVYGDISEVTEKTKNRHFKESLSRNTRMNGYRGGNRDRTKLVNTTTTNLKLNSTTLQIYPSRYISRIMSVTV